MVIHNLHSIGIGAAPDETNPPLRIDADTALACTVALQSFKPIPWRRKQIGQFASAMQIGKLASRSILNVLRQFARAFAAKYPLRLDARKRGYHQRILSHPDNMSS
jgi:hypothetical protein